MTKEEKIKEAYGSRYHKLKESINSNGWINQNITTRALFDSLQFNDKENLMRPLELRGIENNNGWVKIESVDDLPIYGGDFWIINSYGSLIEASFLVNRKVFFKFGDIKATHYQPIIKPNLPIY